MKIPLPSPCSKFASHPILLRKKFEEVKLSLNEAIARTNTSEFKGTSARREYNLAFRRALKDFEAAFKSAKNGGEKREVINAAILRYKVEARFCLSLTNSKASSGVEARSWKSAEIASLRETLIAKPRLEGPLLFTPKIFEIKRVSKFLGEHADSDATHDDISGCIELTDICFLDPHAKSAKKNSAYPAYFILHELGHAFSTSLMRSYKEIRSSGSQNDFLGYIFGDDFFDLSGWQIVRSGYKIVDNGYSVKIGRNQYTLGSLVEVDGKIREYRYNSTYRTLYFHRGKGNYPGSYSRTDPYEDWADTFADYARRPKRLIDRSPEKFQYMEGLFRIYDADKSVQEYVRAHNPIAKIRTRVDTLTQSSEHLVPLKMFGRLSLFERHHLASSGARNQELKSLPLVDVLRSIEGVDEESLMRQFIRRLDKQPQAVRADLEGILKLYNPAILKALAVLEKGHRVAIFADRGDVSITHQNTEPAQNPLRQGLSMFLGEQFDPSRLYLLSDPLKSSRLNKSTNPEKAAALLAEFARGASIRGSLVKPLHHSVDHVYYYDAFPQRNSQIAKMVREEGLLSKLTFINILQYSSEDLASQLLRSVPGTVRNELHVFALDNCLINLAPRYRITFRDSAKVLREVKFNEFLLKPDPEYWITNSLALLPEIPKRTLRSRLQWDDSDFFDLSRAREQIRIGLEFNRMFRRVTG